MVAPVVAAAGVSALGSLVGGLFGKSSAKKQNRMQIQAAREQMDFQERMRDTAHQAEVKDLRLAGLNPILSAGGKGAASPGGAQPNIVGEDQSIANAVSNMASSALQAGNVIAQTKLLDRQAETEQAKRNALQVQSDLGYYDALVKAEMFESGRLSKRWLTQMEKEASEEKLAAGRVPEQQATAKFWKGMDTMGSGETDSWLKGLMFIKQLIGR